MNTADVGYMYNLILWHGTLFIIGASTNVTESELLDSQEMEGGTVIFDAETYDEVLEMQEYLEWAGDLPKEFEVKEYLKWAGDLSG